MHPKHWRPVRAGRFPCCCTASGSSNEAIASLPPESPRFLTVEVFLFESWSQPDEEECSKKDGRLSRADRFHKGSFSQWGLALRFSRASRLKYIHTATTNLK